MVNSVEKKEEGCNKNANISMGYREQEYSYFHLFGHMEYTEYVTVHACKKAIVSRTVASTVQCTEAHQKIPQYHGTRYTVTPLYRKYDI